MYGGISECVLCNSLDAGEARAFTDLVAPWTRDFLLEVILSPVLFKQMQIVYIYQDNNFL